MERTRFALIEKDIGDIVVAPVCAVLADDAHAKPVKGPYAGKPFAIFSQALLTYDEARSMLEQRCRECATLTRAIHTLRTEGEVFSSYGIEVSEQQIAPAEIRIEHIEF